jgi:two-component system, NtrC family, sensor kinase
MSKKVIIMGGGVAGMSAAHELIERGYQVEVFDRNPLYVGGKARSVEVWKQKTKTLIFFISIFLFLAQRSVTAQEPFVYTADQSLMDIGQHVRFYKDETNALNFEQIKSLPDSVFQQSTETPMRFGVSTSSIWLKFAIKNQTESPLFLAFQTNALRELNVFIYDEAGKLSIKNPFDNNTFQRGNIVLDIGTSPKFLYVKLKSNYSLQLPLVLDRIEPLNYYYYKIDAKNGLCLGILLSMALYNLFIFFLVKDRLYLYYCLYVLASLWTMGHLTGLGLLIWGDYPVIAHCVGLPFVLLSAWLFTVRFLNLDKNMPRTYTAIKIVCVLIACVIPIDFLNLQIIRGIALQTLTPISMISMLIMGIISHFQGNKNAKYYVLGWVFFLGGTMITSLSYSKLLPYNYFTLNAGLFGACLESILLAFALANRINIYRTESAEAQALAFRRLEENEHLVREQNKSLEGKVRERTTELETSLARLKTTQSQLIQSEKLASLGELTAGISHEIQNPLNFVSNFSELSIDIVKELKEEMEKSDIDKSYVEELFGDLVTNQEKINHHSKRASSIVKGMLAHSRASTGAKEITDINKLADEYLRLSYHGLRAKDKNFNAEIKTTFAESLPTIEVIPQDVGRVLLNLFNNAFYAVHQRKNKIGVYSSTNVVYPSTNVGEVQNLADVGGRINDVKNYTPTIKLSTQNIDNQIIIKIADNGTGIPESVKEKIFQPFFTTKPTGEGTGLGLSLSYDIITKGHNGTIEVHSKEGEGTEFVITLPMLS